MLQSAPLDADRLRIAREAQASDGNLDRVASQLGFRNGEEALRAVGEAFGLELVDLTKTEIDLSILDGFPLKAIHRYSIFPIRRDLKNQTITIATADAFDLHALDDVGAATGLSVEPVLAFPDELGKLIRTHLGVGAETIDGLIALRDERDGGVEVIDELDFESGDESDGAQEASVVRLVNELLSEAVNARASDIHLESQAAGIKIRYRIDGVLQTQPAPPEINQFQAAIVSRLKIMARLNIAEKRVPQDGRIKLRVSGREIDIRVSLIPMLHGESVVMRVLDKDNMKFSLLGIGMEEDTYADFSRMIRLPHGIVLVTGPTGSGKTTSLYSALSEIKDETTKIITTEDPIEYQLEGINQIQVHSKVGLTFAASLRAILRHDPDVVLIGEIRDLETAQNAIQASLTGHLVFSTLHTNDAAGAFMRLNDMGVEPFLVASTLEGAMAQRLVRTLCPECRKPSTPEAEDVPDDFPLARLRDEGKTLFEPVGCRACRETGYSGRLGIYELLVSSEEIRHTASERISSTVLKELAVKSGMRTLRHDGWLKVMRGQTSVAEVIRVTKSD